MESPYYMKPLLRVNIPLCMKIPLNVDLISCEDSTQCEDFTISGNCIYCKEPNQYENSTRNSFPCNNVAILPLSGNNNVYLHI